jgi:GNAT superfamily N-acetyltransferase
MLLTKEHVHIRKAEARDIPSIYNLVKELAIYEKEEHAVKSSIDDYSKAFEEQIFDAFVAEVDNQVVGMALFYTAFSTWKGKMHYLEDFYVKNTFRRKGIGQSLFNAFIENAQEQNCTMVKWEVLDWNTDAIKFYKRNNALIETCWWDGKIIF